VTPSEPSEPARRERAVNAAGESAYGARPMQCEATRLMIQAKHGDREAFDHLVESLRGRAFHVAHSLVGSRDDAMELAQEAFLRTYRARESFRESELFLPWFHQILRNVCYTFLRKHRKITQRSLSAAVKSDDGDATDWDIEDKDAPLPSEAALGAERARAFWTAFRTLSARDREILALRHFKELAYQDIADALGIPIGTVMSRLFHARRRLREALGGVLDEDNLLVSPRRADGKETR
jgi:RNA polymerase sigma-70 factor (ECF subfamily)